MQGPFDQQTDNAGFYMPLLGAQPATQFCTIIVRPRAGQSAETLGPALSKAVSQLDPWNRRQGIANQAASTPRCRREPTAGRARLPSRA